MIKRRVQKICLDVKNLWCAKPLFAAAVVFFFVFAVYAIAYIPAVGASAIDDHFFHFRYASLIKEKGLDVVKNFPWIYYTKMAQEHIPFSVSLFHFALIPFTYIKNPILGLKISDIFWASLAYSSFYYLLRKIRIKWAFFYVLILLSFPYFSIRMLMGRAFILTPFIIFWELYLAGKKRYKTLFFLVVFHVFWHQATFFIPIVVVGLVEISRYLIEQKFVYKNIISTALGTVVGMSFFPGFPGNIWSWVTGLFIFSRDISGVPNMDKIEGIEILPVNLLSFWTRSDVAVFLLILGVAVFLYFYLKDREADFFRGNQDNFAAWRILVYPSFLLVFLFFCFAILSSGRLLDFYFVGTIFLLALVLQRVFAEEGSAINSRLKSYIFFGVVIFFGVAFLSSLSALKENSRKNDDYRGIGEASKWIKERSTEGEVVFLHRWDNFPAAFFYNQKNNYTMGIEPNALLGYDPSLYWKWYNIFLYNFYCGLPKDCSEEKEALVKTLGSDQGKVDEFNKENSKKIIGSIKNDFKSRFIISSSSTFNSVLRQNLDLIDDSFLYTSKETGAKIGAFELK
jgi:hypothetical protein